MSGGWVLIIISATIFFVGLFGLVEMGNGNPLIVSYVVLGIMGGIIGAALELLNYTKDGEK